MHLQRSETQQWRATPYEGVQICVLRSGDNGGGSVLLKVSRGATFPAHDHPGGEEVYVIEGRVRIGEAVVRKGDYLWTPPGGVHDLTAEEDALLFINAPEGIRVVE